MDDSSARPAFFGRSMRRHWLMLLAVVLVGLLGAGAYVAGSVPKYSSTSVVFLEPLAGNPFSPATPPTRNEQLAALTTEAGLVHTQAVVELARESVGDALGDDAGQLIATEVPSNSQVVHITYTADSPAQARSVAGALAEAYLQYRSERAADVLEARSAMHDEQIASATQLLDQASAALNTARTAEKPDQAAVLDLEQQVSLYANQLAEIRLEASNAQAESLDPGDIIDPASLPTVPDGVDPLLIAGGIVLLAVATGIGLALLREHLHQRILDGPDLVAAGIGPVLGSVEPLAAEGNAEAALDDYRRLSNALQRVTFLPNNTVLLAGLTEGTAARQVSEGLAQAFEEAGLRTVVVMADGTALLDGKAAASAQDDGAARNGLSELLNGQLPPTEARTLLVQVSEHVSVLEMGREPQRLSALVQHRALATVLATLQNASDVVLVVGPAADSATGGSLMRACREAVFVAALGRSTAREASAARELLGNGGAEMLGSVLLRRSSRRRRATPPQPALQRQEAVGTEPVPAGGSDAGGSVADGPGTAETGERSMPLSRS